MKVTITLAPLPFFLKTLFPNPKPSTQQHFSLQVLHAYVTSLYFQKLQELQFFFT